MGSRRKKLFSLSVAEKVLLIQSWLLLAYTRAAILTTSFKRLAAHLEHHRNAIEPPTLTPEQLDQASRTGHLVAVAARYTPWQSLCLAQVLVTQRLLAKRGIPGQFYLGVRRGCERMADPSGLSAHAWLQCGDKIVNGTGGHEAFTVVSIFRWGAGEAEATLAGKRESDPASGEIQCGGIKP